jgi:diacylglycerol kinase family enzyme
MQGERAAALALKRGYRWIVAAGGDGTVMSVLSPLVREGGVLCLLPLGTANDFASYLEIAGVDHALATLLHGTTARLDVTECQFTGPDGRSATGMFTSTAGVGVMGRLAELEDTRTAALLKRTLGNCVWPMLATAATLSVPLARARVAVAGRELERSIAALELAKLPKAGGIELTPDASADSGILHAWLAEGARRGELVHTLRHALQGGGKLLRSRFVQYFSSDPARNTLGVRDATELSIETSPALPLHLNGDYVGNTPAHFRVRPSALRVRVPNQHVLARTRREHSHEERARAQPGLSE